MADGNGEQAEPRTVAPATMWTSLPPDTHLLISWPPTPGEAATCTTPRIPALPRASRNVPLLVSLWETTSPACPQPDSGPCRQASPLLSAVGLGGAWAEQIGLFGVLHGPHWGGGYRAGTLTWGSYGLSPSSAAPDIRPNPSSV